MLVLNSKDRQGKLRSYHFPQNEQQYNIELAPNTSHKSIGMNISTL